MSIEKIWCYEMGSETFGLATNGFTINEIVVVEPTNAGDRWETIRSVLPAYGTPGSTTTNPLQLTFTLNQSRHPDNAAYVLVGVSDARQDPETGFWLIPVTYSTQIPGGGAPPLIFNRRDQAVAKPDSTNPADHAPITDPTSRPPVWSSNATIVDYNTYFDLDDEVIYHTNGLPLTKAIKIPIGHKVWTWTYNELAEDWDEELLIDELLNKCNQAAFTIPQGNGATYTVPLERMKCVKISGNEEYETPSGSTTEYHYVRVSMTFELSRIKWTLPPLSLHTKAKIVAGSNKLDYIRINDQNARAKEPWPLKADGTALTPTELSTLPRSSWGRLQADGADLVMCETADFGSKFTALGFTLPRKIS